MISHVYDSIHIHISRDKPASTPQLSKGKTAEISGTISSLVFFLGALVASTQSGLWIGARIAGENRWQLE